MGVDDNCTEMHCEKDLLEKVTRNINSYPDFPKAGIIFRDIFSVLKTPDAFQALSDILLQRVKAMNIKPDVIVGLEARGFLLGPIISLPLGISFVPVRKKGKLPGEVIQESYKLEYGMDTFEMQSDSIKPGQNVVIVDDLLATGGSLSTACKLVKQLGGNVLECIVVMELKDLKGRDNVEASVFSFVQY